MSGRALVEKEEHAIGHLNWRESRDLGVPSSDQPFWLYKTSQKPLFICGNSKNMLCAFTAAGI